jgi:hypothetical protein
MSDQKIDANERMSQSISSFLPDPDEIPRTIFWCLCLLAYATMAGIVVGHADFGFAVGAGAAFGLGTHRIAVRRDWALRRKIPCR